MEQTASIQKANQQHRLVEWSRCVEACRNSGLSVGQWCQDNGIAVSTYFSWQKKVFQALKEVREVTFAEVPIGALPALRAYRSYYGGKRCTDSGL